jgi:anti-anti-sigma factor
MSISTSIANNIATINMTGRFDFNTQRDFKEAYDPQLSNPAVSEIEVNLAGVDYLDSSALGMLLMLRERATAAGKNLKLSKPGTSVAQILEIANFAKLFIIEK